MTDSWRDRVSEAVAAMATYKVPVRTGPVRAKLDSNELPFPLSEELAAELGRELASVDLHRYPSSDCAALRDLLAAHLQVAPDHLLVGNGSNELIAYLVTAFRRPRPGADRPVVLYPVPSFAYYRVAALAYGAEPVEVPLTRALELDEPALIAAIERRRPNLLFFSRPNNPTGTLWARRFIEQLIVSYPDTLVVVDEAYIYYGGDSFLSLLAQHENLLILRTLSKIGLAAARIGVLVGHPDLLAEVNKVRAPYSVGALNQRAAEWLLTRCGAQVQQHCEQISAERDRLYARLCSYPGVQVYPSQGNMLFLELGDRAEAVWNSLAQAGVRVRQVEPVGPLDQVCLRVTAGAPQQNDLFLQAFEDALARTTDRA